MGGKRRNCRLRQRLRWSSRAARRRGRRCPIHNPLSHPHRSRRLRLLPQRPPRRSPLRHRVATAPPPPPPPQAVPAPEPLPTPPLPPPAATAESSAIKADTATRHGCTAATAACTAAAAIGRAGAIATAGIPDADEFLVRYRRNRRHTLRRARRHAHRTPWTSRSRLARAPQIPRHSRVWPAHMSVRTGATNSALGSARMPTIRNRQR